MCNCIAKTNEALAEHNAELVINLLDDSYAFVAVTKKDPKKRGKIPYLAAGYCPFCGEKYAPRETTRKHAAE